MCASTLCENRVGGRERGEVLQEKPEERMPVVPEGRGGCSPWDFPEPEFIEGRGPFAGSPDEGCSVSSVSVPKGTGISCADLGRPPGRRDRRGPGSTRHASSQQSHFRRGDLHLFSLGSIGRRSEAMLRDRSCEGLCLPVHARYRSYGESTVEVGAPVAWRPSLKL